ncbi:MAG: DUF928 domain-containing protein [Calothrix sp. MO_192.B10]|nr:DUF928 domain-containing protein [Calothrix sp. MO_192.B10]
MKEKFAFNSNQMKKLLVVTVLCSIFIANAALASYKPPKKPSRPRTTTSHATRNGFCLQDTTSNLTLLAPVGHIGQTTSTQPIFAWFLPTTKASKMKFSIFEYVDNARGKKLKSFELDSEPGKMMKFSPPPEKFTFETGKTYLWQISLLCDRNNPINNIFAEAVIKIVPKSPGLASQISQAKSMLKQAQIYADARLWYDAYAEVSGKPQGQAFKLQMLNKLSKLEAQAASEVSSKKLKKYLATQALELEKLSKSR